MAHPATVQIVSKASFLERKTRDFQALITGAAVGFEEVLERHTVKCWVLFSILYFAWVNLISSHKQLWFDEVVTYSVDHVPTWANAWSMLQLGVDANPPLFHVVNRTLLALFGDTDLVQRGSSIFGFWAMSLCVYVMVRRHHSAAAAWVAALIPSCSGAAYFATEARPYGMVMGFVALGMICWLNLADSTARRSWWLSGLSLSLAGAISSHYYAVFTIAPFIGAELTRAVKRAKIDWAVLLAVIASYWPLVIFYTAGLMAAANQYTGSTDKASLLLPFQFWEYFMSPVMGSIATAVALAVAWGWLSGRQSSFTLQPNNVMLVAAWFCILPLVVVLGARYVTHAFELRYAVTAVIGAAMLIGVGFDSLRRAVPGAAGLAILVLLLPVSADAVAGRNKPRWRHIEYGWVAATQQYPDYPVVYGMPLEFVQAWFNAPTPELRRRITCLVDVKEASNSMHSTTADLGVINLKPALPVPALGYQEFVSQRKPFYLIHQPAIYSWASGKLVEDGAVLELKGFFGGDELYLVTWSPAETAPLHQPKP